MLTRVLCLHCGAPVPTSDTTLRVQPDGSRRLEVSCPTCGLVGSHIVTRLAMIALARTVPVVVERADGRLTPDDAIALHEQLAGGVTWEAFA